jgi:hypothetical protein
MQNEIAAREELYFKLRGSWDQAQKTAGLIRIIHEFLALIAEPPDDLRLRACFLAPQRNNTVSKPSNRSVDKPSDAILLHRDLEKELNTRDFGPQPKGCSLRPPWPQGSNTEVTEGLRALRVKARGSTEVTETLFLVAVVPRWVKSP